MPTPTQPAAAGPDGERLPVTLNLPAPSLQFLRLLNAAEVAYLVIGGCAVAFHGYRRPILDLDVFVDPDAVTARKLVGVLEAFGHGVAPEAAALFRQSERVIRIGQPPFRVAHYAPDDRFIHFGEPPTQVEVMTTISGVAFAPCYAARVMGVVDGVRVPVIGLRDLRTNKAASIREKDADDLAHLPRDGDGRWENAR
jgi:hypothetical protein